MTLSKKTNAQAIFNRANVGIMSNKSQPRALLTSFLTACVATCFAACVLVSSGVAIAQTNNPPLPMPRPDFLPGGTPSTPPPMQSPDVITQTAVEATNLPTEVKPEQPVMLQSRISENGAIVPEGVSWRVFSTVANSLGQLELVSRSDQSSASISLPPGEYLLHAAFGHAQISDTLIVEEGNNSKTVILDAGGLILNSSVSGDFPIAPARLQYDIYSSGLDDERVAVVRNLEPGEIVHLNAGVYSVESRWGDVNATVRADIRIEPGELTEARLFHKAGLINLKLVSASGGEAIADVEWTVNDTVGTPVFSFFGAFPSLVLSEGEYTILAKLGSNVFNRRFEVKAGAAREIEVLTTVF